MTVPGAIPAPVPAKHIVAVHRKATCEYQALWCPPEKQASFDEWLGRSARFIQENGGRVLMELEPFKALYGEYLPTLARLLIWPDADSFDQLRQSATYSSLGSQLAGIVEQSTITVTRMHPEIHASPDVIVAELDPALCYEICTFWDRPDAAPGTWDSFITAVSPSIEAHGGHPLFVFEPVRRERGDFFPNRLCIAAWDSVEHFESFTTAPEHEEISRLRWLAVSRMDAIATRLR